MFEAASEEREIRAPLIFYLPPTFANNRILLQGARGYDESVSWPSKLAPAAS